jgi:predicted ester cyclase
MPSYAQEKTNQPSVQSTTSTGMKTDQDRNKAIIHRLYEEVLNTGKWELLDQIVSPEFTGISGDKGPAGFARAIKPVMIAFPDIKWTIEDVIAEGDKVMVKWSWTGTNTSSFDGFPVTNKAVKHHAINIFQFDGHQIIKAWMESDRLGFFQQIGVIAADAITPPAKK